MIMRNIFFTLTLTSCLLVGPALLAQTPVTPVAPVVPKPKPERKGTDRKSVV